MAMSEHLGHRERVRERYLQSGLEGFAPHEVLELLLFYCIPQQDVNPLSHRLLDEFGSLHAVLEAAPQQLCHVQGISERTSILISMLLPVFRLYEKDALGQKPRLRNFRDAGQYCRTLFLSPRREQLYLVCLNQRQQVLSARLIASGSISEVPAYPRVCAEEALRFNAHMVLLCHNHPGDTPEPSPADVQSTGHIAAALSALGILLIDHLILAGESLYSFSHEGLLTCPPDVDTHLAGKDEFSFSAYRE